MTVNVRMSLEGYRGEATLLGICPMSEEIVRATMREAAAEAGFVPMFIATPRQVDADRGYTGWSQDDLITVLESMAQDAGYDGEYIVARDHGGPYQSMRDRGDPSVPIDDAMRFARELFERDVQSGFDVLHVDATEDPRIDGTLDLESVAERTTELIDYIESVLEEAGADPIYYEVGTEEIRGGMTETDDFERFNELIESKLADVAPDALSRVVFVVGQVGTSMNISRENDFDPEKARTLVDITDEYDHFLKVHYTDWLTDAQLSRFPELGIGAANVGPEYAGAIVESLESLEERERSAIAGEDVKPSSFMTTIGEAAIEDAPWKKFAPTDLPEAEHERYATENRRDIAICVGRYVLTRDDVNEAREQLYANLWEYTDVSEPHEEVIAAVRSTLHRYVEAFELGDV